MYTYRYSKLWTSGVFKKLFKKAYRQYLYYVVCNTTVLTMPPYLVSGAYLQQLIN